MALTKQKFSEYIKRSHFREMFNDMGWNNDTTTQSISVDNVNYTLEAVAEKSGFKILLCKPNDNGQFPEYATRKKIETKVTKLFQEHLIIFIDTKKTEQIWQLVVRESGKPTKVTETRWHEDKDPDLLYQRASGIFFRLDEEERITIVDVTQRVGENFHQNNEKVTKQFYEKFKAEHREFRNFIKGIENELNKDWYASLMLNRLMFCYFIQKKGFLDENINYLRDKLRECKEKNGRIQFYSFYRDFLLVLFHKGLNEPNYSNELEVEIGKVPYLNGGLFDEHELEKAHPNLDINDKAFERLFDFFDQYEWHLDTRITATGKDINPDVIGYIFEKYINDRANMGAYYTKEDITDYISKNCILPYLFDETQRNYAKAFTPEGELWQMVKQSGDKYIYDAVKKGMNIPLPEEIAQGIEDVSKRTDWNKPATVNYALPTEIWREVVDRRRRYTEVKGKIDNGELTTINDFITYNLNIRQFAQDAVENTNDPDLLRHFYKALNSVTILDPTCGSGAFLFAAMNILEPLYEGCILRMRAFVEDEDRANAANKRNFTNEFKYFREVLENIQSPQHPNLQYFIYKSIILRNLYGVDIMKEAVEIAKLRLFLKLVATVDADYHKRNFGLEPLPDIDFNIRAGNSLVGFATEEELKNAGRDTLDFDSQMPLIEDKCDVVAKTFSRYKEIQLTYGDDFKEFKIAKMELNERLNELNKELNQLLYQQNPAYIYEDWLNSHQPFHWFAEFYEIIHDKGGFDVIIGNPPYVNLRGINYSFANIKYKCIDSGDLFALTVERGNSILSTNCRYGFIIPLSGLSSEKMASLRDFIFRNSFCSWNSYYSASDQPASLFEGVRHRLLITLNKKDRLFDMERRFYSTNFIKWFSIERDNLYSKFIVYAEVPSSIPAHSKISSDIEKSIIDKLSNHYTLSHYMTRNGSVVYYHNAPVHWGKVFDFVPYFSVNGEIRKSSHLKEIFLNTKEDAAVVICLLNSSLFYWFNWQYSNCRDLSKNDISRMKLSIHELSNQLKNEFILLKSSLMNDYKKYSRPYKRISKNIITEFDAFYPLFSKSIIDQIDTLLASCYGFTAEELDFIISYDIKYRMGKELENSDEE